MEVKKFKIEGLALFTPDIYQDERGRFIETYNKDTFKSLGYDLEFKQDNESVSKKNVLRGLHLQTGEFAQGKLVRVSQGSVIDYAVDLRKGSPTFGEFEHVYLDSKRGQMFWVPEGFAHGFLSLEDNTTFVYKCTNVYSKEHEVSVNPLDEELGILITMDLMASQPNLIISEKDKEGMSLENFRKIIA